MAEYHVGCGIAGIYAGTLNKNGATWRNKTNVTIEALDAVAEYLYQNEKELRFSKGSKDYALRIVELEVDV